MSDINIKPIIKEAWHHVKGTKLTCFVGLLCMIFSYLIGLTLMSFIMSMLYGVSYVDLITANPSKVMSESFAHASIFNTVFTIGIIPFIMAPFIAALSMAGIKVARGEKITPNINFNYFHKLLPTGIYYIMLTVTIMIILIPLNIMIVYLFTTINIHTHLSYIVLTSALITLNILVPLMIVTLYLLGFCLIVDKNMNPFKALSISIKRIKGNFWKIISLLIIVGLISMIGGMTIIGYLWVLPLTLIVTGIVYRTLSDKMG